jgi:hypothetical protein
MKQTKKIAKPESADPPKQKTKFDTVVVTSELAGNAPLARFAVEVTTVSA